MLWCVWDWPKDLFTEYHHPFGDLGSDKVNISINTIEITSCRVYWPLYDEDGGGGREQKNREKGEDRGDRLELCTPQIVEIL